MTICARCKVDRDEAFFFRKGKTWQTCLICSGNSKVYHKYRNPDIPKLVGNKGLNRKYEPRIASARRVWYTNHYKQLGLSFEMFLKLSQQDCYYCGEKPSNTINYFKILRDNGDKVSDYGIENGDFVYNGVDKKIYDLGYVEGNIVPCCWKCNKMKQRLTDQEFIDQCKNVTNHQNN